MTIYIAFIAAFNLCLGYALGVYVGVLPGLPQRRSVNRIPEPSIAPVAPAPVAAPALGPRPAVQSVFQEPIPPDDEPTGDVDSPPKGRLPAFRDILAGVDAFRSSLDSISTRLDEAPNDRRAMDNCAGELKQVSDDYLDKAAEALETLGSENPATAGEEHRKLQATLVEHSDGVRRANLEIDEILAETDTSMVREKLLASTGQLSESTTSLGEAISIAAREAEAASEALPELAYRSSSLPLPDGFSQLETIIDELDAYYDMPEPRPPLQVAAVSIIEGAGTELLPDRLELLLSGISHLVTEALTDGQLATADDRGRLLLLLSGDDEVAATMRLEQLRQQVAATTFRHDITEVFASLSCAVANSALATSRDELLEQLDESMEEASRFGESRTFHHNGKFATPVVPQELEIASMEVAI